MYPRLSKCHKGITLIEIILGIGIFLLFAVGIFSGLKFIFTVVYQSRVRILETAILNEQIEIVRNMSFYDVGIINGSPAGNLEATITTVRNGISFDIVRTVRNIDDEYDGTIGGDPNDTSPADYKLVEISVNCVSCRQRVPLTMTSYIAPKYIEGNPDNGALFIQVFDAQAQPVAGATLDIDAVIGTTTIDITDTTDNEGYLRIVDLPAGVNEYTLVATKAGYTTDQTESSTEALPNPVKPFASVVAQDVTEISLSIDRVSQINLTTKNIFCNPQGSVQVNRLGTKLKGTDPETLKVNDNIVTDGSGVYGYSSVIWDSYGFRATGYDILGTVPAMPLSVLPNTSNDIDLILGPDSDDSLVVYVYDSVTSEPISDATVRLTDGAAFDQSSQTGVGYIRQTDWSGGSGQENMLDDTMYDSDNGGVNVISSAGNMMLQSVGPDYVASGELVSSVFDLGVGVNYLYLDWQPIAQPVATGENSLRIQVATSASSTPATWNFLGPDGTDATYYDQNNFEIHAGHDNDQYFRYKVYLSTNTTTQSPTLSDITMTYTTACTPPGQVYFGNLVNATEYTATVSKDGYETSTQAVIVSGDIVFGVSLNTL
ncbi:hypothetical protein H6758_02855 [Candidatus Nomurabacteria bacterium]|nr:hypothetical protein [Candidatus Nomurabacteria bacterium]